jgi:hypothetical protein
MSDHRPKLSEAAAPFLESGEPVLGAIMAAPKGNANTHASGGAGIRTVAGQMGALEITAGGGGEVRLQCQAKPAREFADAFDRAKSAG